MNEVENRIDVTGGVGRPDIVEHLRLMLNRHNNHVRAFRHIKDVFRSDANVPQFRVRLAADRAGDGRTHNLPTESDVAALIPNDFHASLKSRAIILHSHLGNKFRINELHPSYLAFQYPLLFPYGEDGFRLGINIGFVDVQGRKRINITMREFFAFRIQQRATESPVVVMSGRLYQQFLVDAYTMIESNRLRYISLNQDTLRSDTYENIAKQADLGDNDLADQGKLVYIPSSYTGGKRYMMQHYLDAMTTCKYYGFPDFFITITCNPKWPEIVRYLNKYKLNIDDRPDICSRIFKIKLDNLIQELMKEETLGRVDSALYTIEFQKRGLPHTHMVLFLHPSAKLPNPENIERMISAELPDKDIDPYLYEVVSDIMMHGPCGVHNPKAPCMQNGSCARYYPKSYALATKVDDDGFPVYKRRNDGRVVRKKGVDYDNRWVVPYNKDLSLRYRAHVNVEWCNKTRSIKYLFKYITKGPDYFRATLEKTCPAKMSVDEVKNYLNWRYISPCESTWRILAFPIQFRTTPVEKLSFHLPRHQLIVYNEDDPANEVVNRTTIGQSKILAWMDANKTYPEASELTYADFPTKFVWVARNRAWKPREKGFSIGRVTFVPQSIGEAYYLRILINIVTGPTCYEDIKAYKGKIYDTFHAACFARGLLDDDKEYVMALEEASVWATGYQLPRLFDVMLSSKSMASPADVWKKTWKILSEDIQGRRRSKRNDQTILTEDQQKEFALKKIEKILRQNGSSLYDFEDMPKPNADVIKHANNPFISEETSYDREKLRKAHAELVPTLTIEHKCIYEEILDAVGLNKGGMFFIYGFGGTGKTYIWSILGATLRSSGSIVLNVASSGIAALLLQGGRTAHSRFGIPIAVNESTLCNIPANFKKADLIRAARLIIWDEAPIMGKHCYEALDRTLRDIEKIDQPFGGKVVIFGGDFRQILPVVPEGGRVETVLASLSSLYLWRHCKVRRLTKNMRLLKAGLSPTALAELTSFSKWILDIGDGLINSPNDGEVEIDIPEDLLLSRDGNPLDVIVDEIYGNNYPKEKSPKFFQTRAILTPRNQDVEVINEYMLGHLGGTEQTYLSSDSVEPSDTGKHDEFLYTQEFLNSIKVSGLPNHELKLKVGAPVMLLRNIDPRGGLCNGTRVLITKMLPHVIEGSVITGDKVDETVYIPRVFVSPPDAKFPFRMRRRQFSLAMAFAMTINKSQGQTLERVGLYLPKPVFSHGQFYVAVSRVTSRQGLKILTLDSDGKPVKTTLNVVYKEIFQNL